MCMYMHKACACTCRTLHAHVTFTPLLPIVCPHKAKSVDQSAVNLLIADLQNLENEQSTDHQINSQQVLSTNQQRLQSLTASRPGTKLHLDSPTSLLG
jgi:hypothetical protein